MSLLGIRFGVCVEENTYHCLLAQYYMLYECNDYCLGEVKNSNQTGKESCRKCRCGSGMEGTPGKADTPRKELHGHAKKLQDHKGVKPFLMLPHCQSRKINQHSRSLVQVWGATADTQLLIYRSGPDLPGDEKNGSVYWYILW